MEPVFTVAGLLGVFINLGAYALLTSGKLKATNPRYQLANIAGTSGILLSLMVEWNLASVLLNMAWLTIGLVGLMRIFLMRRKA